MRRERKESGCLWRMWCMVVCVVCGRVMMCVFGCVMVCVVVFWFVWLCYGLCGAPLMSNPTFWASLRCQVVSWITRISPGFGRFDTFMRRDIYRHNRNKSQYIPYLPYNLHSDAVSLSWDKKFRIFQICAILPVEEWQYILSLIICSIIQHWWLILIVGGWLIVAMLQYAMVPHTHPSLATSSPPSLPSSHLFIIFLLFLVL